MEQKISDSKWNELAVKNAKYRAHIHIEAHQPEKVAEAFEGLSPTIALEYLFELAQKARAENKSKKAITILEAVALIDRTTGAETDVTLKDEIVPGKETVTVSVKKYTPAEVFSAPIIFEVLEN